MLLEFPLYVPTNKGSLAHIEVTHHNHLQVPETTTIYSYMQAKGMYTHSHFIDINVHVYYQSIFYKKGTSSEHLSKTAFDL